VVLRIVLEWEKIVVLDTVEVRLTCQDDGANDRKTELDAHGHQDIEVQLLRVFGKFCCNIGAIIHNFGLMPGEDGDSQTPSSVPQAAALQKKLIRVHGDSLAVLKHEVTIELV